MPIIPTPGTGPARSWRRGDHCLCHGKKYTVLGRDLSGPRVQLAPGDDADHPGTIGRVFAPISSLIWRA
jgi:hypothetical protein